MVRTSLRDEDRRRQGRRTTSVNRCHFCGGPFGLIRHHSFRNQFCRLGCKNTYLQSRMRDVATRKRMLAAALSLSVFDRLFGPRSALTEAHQGGDKN